ncbi:MAG: hypothetical protein ABIB71_03540 [Candidatus Woesearchaeota archaeon]
MSKETLLIGVSHTLRHYNDVIEALEQEKVNGKKVMLEIHKYPFTGKFLDKESKAFYSDMARYIISRGGNIISGDNHDLVQNARTAQIMLCSLLNHVSMPLPTKKQLLKQQASIVSIIERDPYFLNILEKEEPDIVILGAAHIPFLAEWGFRKKNSYKEIYIPKSCCFRSYVYYTLRTDLNSELI